ncbi:FCD domain-containing protein [Psychromicrobium xiongbiense]|uniref:FCD domain-containing protein n=1 Tax=Psychromicrobium xiongbiense TaxID=3051184 RepID=UPI002555D383|nr:FCD domain-containing protein [Psychromicrobium sp. YIM S02556]
MRDRRLDSGDVDDYEVAVRELVNLHEAHLTFHLLAIRLAALRRDQSALDAMGLAVKVCREAAERGDLKACREAAVRFRDLAVQASGNSVLIRGIESLQGSTMRLLFPAQCAVALAVANERIYQAIADRDAERAEAVLSAFLQETLDQRREEILAGDPDWITMKSAPGGAVSDYEVQM